MKPNFLVIQVDQLSERVLKKYNGTANTPNIDALIQEGIAFTNCVCQYPLCQPSRCSLWSGLYPHKTNVLSNGRNWPTEDISKAIPTLGTIFKDNDYKTIHFGKKHDAGSLNGFECVPFDEEKIEPVSNAWPYNKDTYHDVFTTHKAVDFLSSYEFGEPLMMVVDLVNPHNICGWIGENKGIHEDYPVSELPELPPNFKFEDIQNRSKAIQYICCSHNRQAQASGWNEDNYRHYLAAYYHYLSLVDSQIGSIIDKLKAVGQKENTYIFLFSDHGDSITARGGVTKQVALYHELVQVPLIVAGPKVPRGGAFVEGLAENIDIVPTLCDFADLKKAESFDGISLKENILNLTKVNREYATSQWHTEWGYTVSPNRMIQTEDFKYIHYLEDNFEEFYDLKRDPYEMKNEIYNGKYKNEIEYMRNLFKKYLEESQDNYFELEAKVAPKWRQHKIGYHNHVGIAAPQEE